MSEDDRSSGGRASGGVQSLERAFSLLEAIADSPDGIGLTQLSRRTGLNSSTVFHLLKTMTQLGYIRQAEETKRYFIGSTLFCVAAAARTEVRIVNAADRIIRELAVSTGNTALFGMRSGDEIVVVAKAEGNGAFQISDRVGGMRPSHCTGMGKVMLAAMTEERLQRHLATYELKGYTPNTITERVRLLQELDEVRRSGLAFDDAEFHPELRCVAAPVHDFTGQVIGALAMSGPAWRLSLQALQARSPQLRAAANELASQLGYEANRPAPANPPARRTGKPIQSVDDQKAIAG
jgi:IclR family transcriptional regulator, KDG regulon repressor